MYASQTLELNGYIDGAFARVSVLACVESPPPVHYMIHILIWQEAHVGQAEIMCLMDYDVPEWSEGQKTLRELNEIVERADAYILGGSIVLFGCNSFNYGLEDQVIT